MSSINTMRGLLVGGAAFAVVVAAYLGEWSVVVILGSGIAAHAALSVHLRRSAATAPAMADPPAAGAPR